jgi:hypothetical protein
MAGGFGNPPLHSIVAARAGLVTRPHIGRAPVPGAAKASTVYVAKHDQTVRPDRFLQHGRERFERETIVAPLPRYVILQTDSRVHDAKCGRMHHALEPTIPKPKLHDPFVATARRAFIQQVGAGHGQRIAGRSFEVDDRLSALGCAVPGLVVKTKELRQTFKAPSFSLGQTASPRVPKEGKVQCRCHTRDVINGVPPVLKGLEHVALRTEGKLLLQIDELAVPVSNRGCPREAIQSRLDEPGGASLGEDLADFLFDDDAIGDEAVIDQVPGHHLTALPERGLGLPSAQPRCAAGAGDRELVPAMLRGQVACNLPGSVDAVKYTTTRPGEADDLLEREQLIPDHGEHLKPLTPRRAW